MTFLPKIPRISIAFLITALSCVLAETAVRAAEPPASQPAATQPSESGPQFDPSLSDQRAVEIADEVLEAVGGLKAWGNTRYVTWNFFGRRRVTWDRQTGDVRLESGLRTSTNDIGSVVLMNLNTRQGRAWAAGQEILDEEQRKTTMDSAYTVWENDAYWMFLPFKLKDPGVILKYRGEGKTKDGRAANIIRLTFKDVGSTPWTMYDLWISRDDHLISQWAYFPNSGDQQPEFTQPWSDWQKHGEIMLSANRGERGGQPAKMTDIAVFESLPEAVFRSQVAVDWPTMIEQSGVRGK